MKNYTLFVVSLFLTVIVTAQETVVNLSHQPGYTQDVYFDFESGNNVNVNVNSWEIAFLRTGSFEFGERINDGLGIEVYEMSTNPSDWDIITPNDINESTSRYYNSDTNWEEGAFDQGEDPNNPMRFGWGIYNPVNHHIEGITTFILKYSDDSYKKFMIEDFFGGYTFKYATWDPPTNTWIDEQQRVLSNNDNQNKLFNYFSLSSNQAINDAPELTNWDIVFQKYVTDVQGMMYPVQGALLNPNVEVAISTNPDATAAELDFQDEINTVGYTWKQFDGSAYTVDSDTYYFLKYENGAVYRFHFLSFEGADTGNFSLGYENVTEQMSVSSFEMRNALKIYPNPTSGKVNISFDFDKTEKLNLEIYNYTGQRVMKKDIFASGTSREELDLSGLSSGIYLLKFNSGKNSITKKLVLK